MKVATHPTATERETETEILAGLPVLSFSDGPALERWLGQQPEDSSGIWLKLRKLREDVTSLKKREVIDAALCYGWIDGQTQKYDHDAYLVRLTPRRARSGWSHVNRERAILLSHEGRMTTRGLMQMKAAQADGRWQAAYAPASLACVPADFQAALNESPEAAARFEALGRSARYAVLHALETVKRKETRQRRIAAFVAQTQK